MTSDLPSCNIFVPQKLPLLKILMTSLHVICGLGLHRSKILGTPMNWTSPKNFLKTLFLRTLALVSLVLGLGLEYSYPWPRKRMSSVRLSLALALPRILFVSLALASSLVSSTPPLFNTIDINLIRIQLALSFIVLNVAKKAFKCFFLIAVIVD